MRALAADEVERIEEIRSLQRTKKVKPSDAEWKQIQRHDAWWNQWKRENATEDDDDNDGDDDNAGDEDDGVE
jgi:hypothetical protein